ncbi:bifunctional (p)ppGpp synthetase/guanosine-3',5'-bis(diphosphate) 3'-pyrophosphohydrolase [Hymenobacter gummosus]|uniref:Bifunctional (P)ppGpp synthetase/guanosine-3',5'-bis(Diphosphate) 3'-pyrophosphohydrolase n=1 Tax=Hymenobacter gummosus TaxID=1776032 RepID=A0A431U1D1_9BACT|nr:HD domain-containing protein [Hymenobacter gummosus]RTQ48914.1 bifunctional (p)ppGpp synthetase/guanosine-3',5'-bis(diphosphate) 3'-pyrophosphohydrolase [Hymenobacter gummosus]
MIFQTAYQRAIRFAARQHQGQLIPSSALPYVVHLSNVAMEILAAEHPAGFDVALAVQLALLHDTLEDTAATPEQLATEFGPAVAAGVQALTKNDALPKAEKMADSLTRIRQQPREVWAVKLADRITNLQEPPAHWDAAKIRAYQQEAEAIRAALAGGHAYLEARLRGKIADYGAYLPE